MSDYEISRPNRPDKTYYLQGLRKFFDMILEKSDLGVYDVWDIVTALRGPDRKDHSEANDVKHDTTGRVRAWISVLGEEYDLEDEKILLDTSPQYTLRYVQDICGGHFANHLREAEIQIRRFDSDFRVFKRNYE